MNTLIGDAAGKIWQFVEQNGPSSISKITNETDLGRSEIQRAIGWLAREEKIAIEIVNGRTETISIR